MNKTVVCPLLPCVPYCRAIAGPSVFLPNGGQGRQCGAFGFEHGVVAGDDAAHDCRRLPENDGGAVDRLAGNIDGNDEIGAHFAGGQHRHQRRWLMCNP